MGLAELAAASNQTQYEYARRQLQRADREVGRLERALVDAKLELERCIDIERRTWDERPNTDRQNW